MHSSILRIALLWIALMGSAVAQLTYYEDTSVSVQLTSPGTLTYTLETYRYTTDRLDIFGPSTTYVRICGEPNWITVWPRPSWIQFLEKDETLPTEPWFIRGYRTQFTTPYVPGMSGLCVEFYADSGPYETTMPVSVILP